MHNDCQTIEKCQENRLKGAEFVREGVHFFVTPCKIQKHDSDAPFQIKLLLRNTLTKWEHRSPVIEYNLPNKIRFTIYESKDFEAFKISPLLKYF